MVGIMAAAEVNEDFVQLADPYRRELLAHCYRMLGSLHDAEDLVQETYLRAWRAYDRFEGRSSLRTWLYRIATTACLTALESRNRRPMPTGLGGPTDTPENELAAQGEVPWLEPIPSAPAEDPGDPASIVVGKESLRLALIAALQHLPPRQRAVLILRDVLKWRAAEVAELVGTTTTAVNSILQRARAQLGQVAPTADGVAEPDDAEQKAVLERYVAAFENYDMESLIQLFTADAVWEMPPFLEWVKGVDKIVRLIDAQCPAQRPGDLRFLPAEANGQPAFGMYLRGEDGAHHAFGLHVVSLTESGAIDHVAVFFDPGLFGRFGLPDSVPAPALAQPAT